MRYCSGRRPTWICNVNRDERTPAGTFRLGRNPQGPSDKTVWVVKFETTAGEPIALLINYAVHAVVLGTKNSLLTGELPGATSRFVEQNYNDKVVAVWTMGAAGDQAPITSAQGPDAEKNFKFPADSQSGSLQDPSSLWSA